MVISVINGKGGVGKTSLSYSIAKDLEYYLISNDDSVIELIYGTMVKIMKSPKLIDNVVYDFGGFADAGVINILNNSDHILIPLTSDLNSVKKTNSLLREIDTKKVVLIANRAEKEDFKDITSYFEKKYQFPIIEVKNSRIWKKTFEVKQSVTEIKNSTKLNSYIYRNSIDGYEQLLDYLKGMK